MVSNLARAVQGLSGFAWERIHARGIGRRQVSCCCQWSASQEVFPEHVGRRVIRADDIHLAISRQANTLSWPRKKKRVMTGQHFELASEIYEKRTADV